MLLLGALISSSGSLGYALPAIIGLESFGVPSPGETALITAAVLASEGKLQIWLVLVIGPRDRRGRAFLRQARQ
jgi:membrane protein DedA with SNARE-associated domain